MVKMPIQTIRIIQIFAIYQIINAIMVAANVLFIHMGINAPTCRPLAIDILLMSTIFLSFPLAGLCRAVKRQKYLVSCRDYKKATLLLTLLSLVLLVTSLNLISVIFPVMYLIGCVSWVMSIRNVGRDVLRSYIGISRIAIKALFVLAFIVNIVALFTVNQLLAVPIFAIPTGYLVFTLALAVFSFWMAYLLPNRVLACAEQIECLK